MQESMDVIFSARKVKAARTFTMSIVIPANKMVLLPSIMLQLLAANCIAQIRMDSNKYTLKLTPKSNVKSHRFKNITSYFFNNTIRLKNKRNKQINVKRTKKKPKCKCKRKIISASRLFAFDRLSDPLRLVKS